jgi:Putative transposase
LCSVCAALNPHTASACSASSGPAQVLEYLSRYTHRTAISNERMQSVGTQQVVFKVRSDEHGGKRWVRLDGPEFVRRFMLHILPKGVKRIRHYGVLAAACKATQLALARAALLMPASNPQARESAAQFMCRVRALEIMRCPCCALGQLRLVQTVPAPARLPAPRATVQASGCRGPP